MPPLSVLDCLESRGVSRHMPHESDSPHRGSSRAWLQAVGSATLDHFRWDRAAGTDACGEHEQRQRSLLCELRAEGTPVTRIAVDDPAGGRPHPQSMPLQPCGDCESLLCELQPPRAMSMPLPPCCVRSHRVRQLRGRSSPPTRRSRAGHAPALFAGVELRMMLLSELRTERSRARLLRENMQRASSLSPEPYGPHPRGPARRLQGARPECSETHEGRGLCRTPRSQKQGKCSPRATHLERGARAAVVASAHSRRRLPRPPPVEVAAHEGGAAEEVEQPRPPIAIDKAARAKRGASRDTRGHGGVAAPLATPTAARDI